MAMTTPPQTIYQANLNSATMFIDLANQPTTTIEQFFLFIQNQSLQTLWFKLDTSNFPNWFMNNPSNGKLGSIAVGATLKSYPKLQRSTPASDTFDSGFLRLYVYTDSSYTVLVDYADLAVTVTLENTELWTNVIVEPFASGNSYSWTGGSLINNVSVESGGWSYQSAAAGSGSGTTTTVVTFTRTAIALPNNSKVRMTFYGSMYFNTQNGACGGSSTIQEIAVTVNGTTVYDTGLGSIFTMSSQTYSALTGWMKFTYDLSAYAGQIVTIVVSITIQTGGAPTCGVYGTFIMDRVVYAGSD
jgi:hypothetical protein